jgi:hypothetical protein
MRLKFIGQHPINFIGIHFVKSPYVNNFSGESEPPQASVY